MGKKTYVKNTDEWMYEENEWDEEASLKAREHIRKNRKKPTSVALDVETIRELKELAEGKGIPYQVLMRSFIIEGPKREKAS